MIRFMTATFVLLGGALYHFSGGPDFAPPAGEAPRAGLQTLVEAAPEGSLARPSGPEIVTRAASDLGLGLPAMVSPAATDAAVADALGLDAVAGLGSADRRVVSGNRVNMRAGPGTGYGVLTVLTRGEPAEVVRVVDGWAEIRAAGHTGWMAQNLLATEG